jgi:hypothetical protein
MKIPFTKKAALAAPVLLASMLSSVNVLAADNRQNFNGSYCDNYYGSDTSVFGHYSNGIYNSASSSKYVSCPVIVDEASVTTGTNNIWVHFTGTGTVSCYMQSRNGNGSFRQSSSGSRSGTGWFSVGNITSDDYWGSYSMYCYVPAYGTINTISMSEKD